MARKIIGGVFLSLDGVMQAPGGPEEDPTGGFTHGGWLTSVFDEELGAEIDHLFDREYDLLLGRRTYDIFAAHWPFMPQDESDPDASIAIGFAKARKYVLTRSDRELEWEGSHRLPDMDALAALKAENGPDLIIQGSSTLYPQLLERGLLDRVTLMIAPVLLGGGKRLFGDGTPPRALRMIEHRLSRNGIAMPTYEPAGPLADSGSFATPGEPSPQERARRQAMAEGRW